MDGNGRWAKKRGLPRKAGHIEGAKAFERCVNYCSDMGVECVTFYAFSTENWKRPKDEVDGIMKLFDKYLDKVRSMDDKNIVLRFLGNLDPLSDSIKRKINDCTEATKNNTGTVVCLALNYGGRDDIVNAVRRYIADGGFSPEKAAALTEEEFSSYLYTENLPDVDLIIRPSGEQRLSNFLIWQAAYAEYVFMDVLWPDFEKKHLTEAFEIFARRNRRFGGV